MTTMYTLTVDWPRIHAAMQAVDQARQAGKTGIGYHVTDVFGGSYRSYYWEERGVPGLVDLCHAIDRVMSDAWQIIHGASRRLEAIVPETTNTYWSVDCDGRPDMLCASHRGAAWRSSRYGGTVKVVSHIDEEDLRRRRDAVIDVVRAAVATALAIQEARAALESAGVLRQQEECICSARDGRLRVTGLAWLAGRSSEREYPSVEVARDFVDRGLVALEALA